MRKCRQLYRTREKPADKRCGNPCRLGKVVVHHKVWYEQPRRTIGCFSTGCTWAIRRALPLLTDVRTRRRWWPIAFCGLVSFSNEGDLVCSDYRCRRRVGYRLCVNGSRYKLPTFGSLATGLGFPFRERYRRFPASNGVGSGCSKGRFTSGLPITEARLRFPKATSIKPPYVRNFGLFRDVL